MEETIFHAVELGHYLPDVYVIMIMPNHVHVLLMAIRSLAN